MPEAALRFKLFSSVGGVAPEPGLEVSWLASVGVGLVLAAGAAIPLTTLKVAESLAVAIVETEEVVVIGDVASPAAVATVSSVSVTGADVSADGGADTDAVVGAGEAVVESGEAVLEIVELELEEALASAGDGSVDADALAGDALTLLLGAVALGVEVAALGEAESVLAGAVSVVGAAVVAGA